MGLDILMYAGYGSSNTRRKDEKRHFKVAFLRGEKTTKCQAKRRKDDILRSQISGLLWRLFAYILSCFCLFVFSFCRPEKTKRRHLRSQLCEAKSRKDEKTTWHKQVTIGNTCSKNPETFK